MSTTADTARKFTAKVSRKSDVADPNRVTVSNMTRSNSMSQFTKVNDTTNTVIKGPDKGRG